MKTKTIKIKIKNVTVRDTQALQLTLNSNFGTRIFCDKRFKKPKHKLKEKEKW